MKTGAQVPFVTIDPPDAKDHDDAVHAVPDPDPRNAGGHIVSVAIADVAHYVRPGSALDREARARAATRSIFPTASCRCCRSAFPTICARCGRNEDRPALAVRMVIGADGRKRSHTFHRVMIRSAAQAALRTGAARGLGPHRRSHRADRQHVPRAALRRLRDGAPRPRRARPARSRHSRAQDLAQVRRHGRSRDHAAAAGIAPADRGIHDPRQCRGRRNAASARACR